MQQGAIDPSAVRGFNEGVSRNTGVVVGVGALAIAQSAVVGSTLMSKAAMIGLVGGAASGAVSAAVQGKRGSDIAKRALVNAGMSALPIGGYIGGVKGLPMARTLGGMFNSVAVTRQFSAYRTSHLATGRSLSRDSRGRRGAPGSIAARAPQGRLSSPVLGLCGMVGSAPRRALAPSRPTPTLAPPPPLA